MVENVDLRRAIENKVFLSKRLINPGPAETGYSLPFQTV